MKAFGTSQTILFLLLTCFAGDVNLTCFCGGSRVYQCAWTNLNIGAKPRPAPPYTTYFNVTIPETAETLPEDYPEGEEPPVILPESHDDFHEVSEHSEETESSEETDEKINEEENIPNYDNLCHNYPTFCKIFLKLSIKNVKALMRVKPALIEWNKPEIVYI